MWTIIIILVLIGILMLLVEILIIPGTGVAGIVGFGLIIAGIWIAYAREGLWAGNVTLGVTLGASIIVLIVALRSKTWKNAMLHTEIDSKVNTIDANLLKVGEKGKTISRCAPMGKANFNDKFYEVTAYADFIDQEIDIEILKISGNKIYIKQIK